MELRTGKADENVLSRSVFRRLDQSYQAPGAADAEAAAGVVSAVDPVTLPCHEAGYLSVIEAANDLAAAGIRARRAQTVVLLPEGSEESLLRSLEDQIREAAQLCGLKITGGHTEVTSAVTRPVVITSAQGEPLGMEQSAGPEAADAAGWKHLSETGRQKPAAQNDERTAVCRTIRKQIVSESGTDRPWGIVAAGRIGLEGTYLLATEREEELLQRFPVKFVDSAKRMREHLFVGEAAAVSARSCPAIMVNCSEGGVFAALWRLAEEAGQRLHLYGFDVDLLRIPIAQETVEITDYFGINPYEMESAGCLLAAVQDPDTVVRALREHDIAAVRIGTLADSRDKLLHNGDETRCLDRPAADALLRLADRT